MAKDPRAPRRADPGDPAVRAEPHALVRLERGRTPAYDGVAITWFDDTQAMRASAASAQYPRVRADEPNFITPGDAPFIITTEHVVIP
ncbi:MAG TPA: EthD domain-containing protein [Candidatus Dormibacteraeota bacterium]|nr:EthD domain-containing protein [Candidatus Dormibacteraeota bacterium]